VLAAPEGDVDGEPVMNLIAMLVLGFPVGALVARRRWAYLVVVVVFLVILPIQTIQVHNDNPADINWMYPVVNAVILAGGLGLVTLGARWRNRRRARGAPDEATTTAAVQ
jgi:peptidoglycan/LPS O-acetylase OafA/YrhL